MNCSDRVCLGIDAGTGGVRALAVDSARPDPAKKDALEQLREKSRRSHQLESVGPPRGVAEARSAVIFVFIPILGEYLTPQLVGGTGVAVGMGVFVGVGVSVGA